MEGLASSGRLSLLVRDLERIGRRSRVLRHGVREPIVRGQRRVWSDAGSSVAPAALLGLVGVGRFRNVPEPPERNWLKGGQYVVLRQNTKAVFLPKMATF